MIFISSSHNSRLDNNRKLNQLLMGSGCVDYEVFSTIKFVRSNYIINNRWKQAKGPEQECLFAYLYLYRRTLPVVIKK